MIGSVRSFIHLSSNSNRLLFFSFINIMGSTVFGPGSKGPSRFCRTSDVKVLTDASEHTRRASDDDRFKFYIPSCSQMCGYRRLKNARHTGRGFSGLLPSSTMSCFGGISESSSGATYNASNGFSCTGDWTMVQDSQQRKGTMYEIMDLQHVRPQPAIDRSVSIIVFV